MAQASQALNLCRATAEFSGSTEQVEGEKLLLISSKIIVKRLNAYFLHFHLATSFRPEKTSSYK
jgi:hypothetical protein